MSLVGFHDGGESFGADSSVIITGKTGGVWLVATVTSSIVSGGLGIEIKFSKRPKFGIDSDRIWWPRV
jgi:hypothetical protein